MWFDSRLRHNAFRMSGLQTFRLPYHFVVASQWDVNLAFTVHAVCYIAHAFRAAIKRTQCCCQGCAEGDERGTDSDIQGSGSSNEGNYKKNILSKYCNHTTFFRYYF